MGGGGVRWAAGGGWSRRQVCGWGERKGVRWGKGRRAGGGLGEGVGAGRGSGGRVGLVAGDVGEDDAAGGDGGGWVYWGELAGCHGGILGVGHQRRPGTFGLSAFRCRLFGRQPRQTTSNLDTSLLSAVFLCRLWWPPGAE